MNSVVAGWLRPWEFVSRASGWMSEIDVLAGDGKLKTTLGRVEGEGVGAEAGRNVCFTSGETIVDCPNTDS